MLLHIHVVFVLVADAAAYLCTTTIARDSACVPLHGACAVFRRLACHASDQSLFFDSDPKLGGNLNSATNRRPSLPGLRCDGMGLKLDRPPGSNDFMPDSCKPLLWHVG